MPRLLLVSALCLVLLLFSAYVRCMADSLFKNNAELSFSDLGTLLNLACPKEERRVVLEKIFSTTPPTNCSSVSDVCTFMNIPITECDKLKLNASGLGHLSGIAVRNVMNGCCLPKNDLALVGYTAFSRWKVWVYSMLSVLIIASCSANGFILFPLMKTKAFQKIIMFLVALAVGVMLSNGLLQLLPGALGYTPNDDISYLSKFVMVTFAIYAFIVFELLLKSLVAWKKGIDVPNLNDTCHTAEENPEAKRLKPMLSSSDRINGECVANDCCVVHSSNDSHSGMASCQDTLAKTDKSSDKRFWSPVCFQPHISSCSLVILVGDMIHNFVDGLAIGSSYVHSVGKGLGVSVAIFSEEFAHEFGDFAALVSSGMTTWQSLFWNSVASLTTFGGAFIGIAVGTNVYATEMIDAFCAGMFIYISLIGLFPELIEQIGKQSKGSKRLYATNLTISLVGILVGILIMVMMAYCSKYISFAI